MAGVGLDHHAHVVVQESQLACDDHPCLEFDFDGDFVFDEAAEVGQEEVLSLEEKYGFGQLGHCK